MPCLRRTSPVPPTRYSPSAADSHYSSKPSAHHLESGDQRSTEGAGRGNPTGGLLADRGDVLEVVVIVKDCRSVVFGGRGGQQIDDSRHSMLASSGQLTLDGSGPLTDLRVIGRSVRGLNASADGLRVAQGFDFVRGEADVAEDVVGVRSECRRGRSRSGSGGPGLASEADGVGEHLVFGIIEMDK